MKTAGKVIYRFDSPEFYKDIVWKVDFLPFEQMSRFDNIHPAGHAIGGWRVKKLK